MCFVGLNAHAFTGAKISLGSSAVAGSGCRLISQARLTVDPGALLVESFVVKEQYGARQEQPGRMRVRQRGEK